MALIIPRTVICFHCAEAFLQIYDAKLIQKMKRRLSSPFSFFHLSNLNVLSAKHSGEKRQDLMQIKRIYFLHKGTYGAKRISRALKAEGIIINHKKVARLMNLI